MPVNISKIEAIGKEELADLLQINIIHNRYDLIFRDYHLYLVDGVGVPVVLSEGHAKLGIYLTRLSEEQRDALACRIFANFPQIDYLEVSHSYTPLEFYKAETYWHVELPETIEEFSSNLSSKTRYNAKWYPKKLTRDKGELLFTHYSNEEVPGTIVEKYLEWKNNTHQYSFSGEPLEYIRNCGITDIYTLTIADKLIAIGMTCDTGEISYFENFSYDAEYHLYSPGMIIYYHIIEEKIKKHIRVFYLSGGELDYKRRYNGIRTETYTGRIFRFPEKLKSSLEYLQKAPPILRKFVATLLCQIVLPSAYRRVFREQAKRTLSPKEH